MIRLLVWRFRCDQPLCARRTFVEQVWGLSERRKRRPNDTHLPDPDRQPRTPWATASWEEALRRLGKPDAVVEELTAGFRVPREVIAYASGLLLLHARAAAPVRLCRASPGDLSHPCRTRTKIARVME
ncbi:hypothetical protein OG515_01015 [Streptomyces melanogenes]|uniref:Transposase n=1 Tax=Streptomyces melanogenes TaxID=67326 RepID=A0ABZ1XWH9_9ACTN|nr:hypothetical protein [Streptomyces melanogenes]